MNFNKFSYQSWLIFILLIGSLKFLIFFVDPLPMFFLGDSASYIQTALTGWIPPDRSFVYGFIIRLIAVSTHSLTSLIAVQVFISGLSSILIAYVLFNFFSVRQNIAFSMGFLCALEPLQLLSERYIMTETFSLFIFALYLVLIFHYLKRPTLIFLCSIQIIGIGLITFRLSFLPIVILNSFLIPLLIVPSIFRSHFVTWQPFSISLRDMKKMKPFFGFVVLHFIISLSLTYSLHLGYKNLNGTLLHRPPAYQYESGFFLLADWSPVVKPVDFPLKELSGAIFGTLKCDLDVHNQPCQRWLQGGLISNIKSYVPDPLEADFIAKETAFNALKRDPIGIASLAFFNFTDYWNNDILTKSMNTDRGSDRSLPDEMLISLYNNFGITAKQFPFLKTFTNKYFFIAWPWYLFLLCIPFIAFVTFIISSYEKRKYAFIVFLMSFIIVAIACSLIERTTVRYLHAAGWLSFIVIGSLLDIALKRAEGRLNKS